MATLKLYYRNISEGRRNTYIVIIGLTAEVLDVFGNGLQVEQAHMFK